jgi:hypothetical protein
MIFAVLFILEKFKYTNVVIHSNFNIMRCLIPLTENMYSKQLEVKMLIFSTLMQGRGIYPADLRGFLMPPAY